MTWRAEKLLLISGPSTTVLLLPHRFCLALGDDATVTFHIRIYDTPISNIDT